MSSLRILLIEDDADARDALRALLELDGYEVDTAAEGQEGLDLARAADPDVALVDIGLPGLDGYEVARHMRAAGQRRAVLVALTGYRSQRIGGARKRPASTRVS